MHCFLKNRVITINQNSLLKPYVAVNTDLGKIAQSVFEKNSFQMMKIYMEIYNIFQQKEEETIWCKNEIFILKNELTRDNFE